MKILFDYNRTLYDPERDVLYEGAFELLKELSERHDLFLVSRNEPERLERIKDIGMESFFKKIVFVEEKTPEIFRDLAGESREVLVVGDSLKSEIAIGNSLGYITVRVAQGMFANETPRAPKEFPRHTVRDVREVKKILGYYEK